MSKIKYRPRSNFNNIFQLEGGIHEIGLIDFNEVTPAVFCLKPELLGRAHVGFIYVYTPWCDNCISHIDDLYTLTNLVSSFGRIFAINGYNTASQNDQLALDLHINEYPMAFLVNKMGYLTPYNYIFTSSSIYSSMLHLYDTQHAILDQPTQSSKRSSKRSSKKKSTLF